MSPWARNAAAVAVALATSLSSTAMAADSVIAGGRLAAGPRLVDGGVLRLTGTSEAGFRVEKIDAATGAVLGAMAV